MIAGPRQATAALLVLLLGGAGSPVSADPVSATRDTETWVGHQINRGRREVHLMGTLETRTDTWVVATVRRPDARTVEISERACRVRVAEVAGVQVSMSEAAVRRLPPVLIRYLRDPRSELWHAGPWRAGWDGSDHDGDGHPGFTIEVDAPLCGGRLHVASEVQSIGRARWIGDALRGELKVKLAQKILGAEGACLSVVSSDSEDRLTGRVAYAKVAPGATCEDLARAGWLDRPLAEAGP